MPSCKSVLRNGRMPESVVPSVIDDAKAGSFCSRLFTEIESRTYPPGSYKQPINSAAIDTSQPEILKSVGVLTE